MSPTISKKEADILKHRASVIAITFAITLCLLKIFGALFTGSLSVLSSMIDSLSDIIGSTVTFIAVKISARPASETHRYGYGKSESLSALFQSAFIAGSGVFVIYDGINRFISPQPIGQTTTGIAIMIFSLIATFFLIAYQRHVYNKTKSQAILADSAHYTVDILTNSSIIVTLVVVKYFGWVWFDTLMAIIISSTLLFNAYSLAKEAIKNLMDVELDDNIRKKIKKTALTCSCTKGIHDLRTRDLGGTYTFEFHLELDGNMSLHEAHSCAHHVEENLLKEFPNAQIIIHQEPAGIEDDRLDNKIKRKKKK